MDKAGENMKKDFKKLIGLTRHSEHVNNYFFDCDVRASVFMSAVVAVLEIIMIILAFKLERVGLKDMDWVVVHIISYIVLFAAAVSVLVYGIQYIRGKKLNKNLGLVIIRAFYFICLGFGIYIGYNDYIHGEQIMAFLTMEIFVFCLFVWKPVRAFILSIITFGGFFTICQHARPASIATTVNYMVIWIAVFMVSVAMYQQRLTEAEQNERVKNVNKQLEKIAVVDELTGLPNMWKFREDSKEMLRKQGRRVSRLLFLFLDIRNFKSYNESNGFDAGNRFMVEFAKKLDAIFEESVVARFSDDHFVILTPEEGMQEKLDKIREVITSMQGDIHLGLNVGAYRPKDVNCSPDMACDRARYVCSSIKHRYDLDYREYDDKIAEKFKLRQYVVNHIEDAIKHRYIRVYYQPVVWAEDSTVCALEALARWEDPIHGFMSPADFIPPLEKYRQIHKLDQEIMRIVCQDIRKAKEDGFPIVPISLNFSRLDFIHTDVVGNLEKCTAEYGIPKNFLHIEVTESAIVDSDENIYNAVVKLRELGYSVWLDDFGSGYSALNSLKDFQFDVMKIDMLFLKGFDENERSRPIISSVVKLAEEIGMRTLSEGVETEEEHKFLRGIGCERLQGYLFGKPMPINEFKRLVNEGELVISDKL
ncbi:putative bifunctional diguanylate cyclase/phosphodiesterase [Eubacterium xylanophilum]|uniref:putative bifunctional diguanylate cyclase/phosphodiesterase n=1 Tax=Eubacterium xylanophilum TaxID=39497 RepID=UPI0004BBE101|nr:GGDEF domain-containing phosphodiesterase [Eubacterium xylanophilum]